MQSLLGLEAPCLFTSNFGVAAHTTDTSCFCDADTIPTVCLDVTSLLADSYGYNSGKIAQLVAHELAVHVAIHGGHVERTQHRHSPYAQPVAHVR